MEEANGSTVRRVNPATIFIPCRKFDLYVVCTLFQFPGMANHLSLHPQFSSLMSYST